MYRGPPPLPSPFLSSTLSSFLHRLSEYNSKLNELRGVADMEMERRGVEARGRGGGGGVEGRGDGFRGLSDGGVESLPDIVNNLHAFFMHVAAQVSKPW